MKKIFTHNIDVNKTAFLNWRIDRYEYINNMIKIAEGYMKSSLILTKQLLIDNSMKDADIVIFPIIFSANHAIELYLKAITWTLNELLEKEKKIEGSHNIKQIFDTVKSRVDQYEVTKENKKEFKRLTVGLQEYIDELFDLLSRNGSKKEQMDFSRYPFDQKYNNHFYVENFDNVVIDLENFYIRFEEIGENLKSIAEYYLYDHLAVKQEYEAEMREYEEEQRMEYYEF